MYKLSYSIQQFGWIYTNIAADIMCELQKLIIPNYCTLVSFEELSWSKYFGLFLDQIQMKDMIQKHA